MLNSLVSPETTTREAGEPRGAGVASVDTFGFLLVPDFTLIAFASAIDTLRLANICSGRTLFAWKLFSPDGGPVMASTGVAVAVHGSYADAGPVTAAVVCGGADIQRFEARELAARLRTLASYGAAIGAVCTGTHVLAKAGLLAGRRCTIHWENHDGFREAFPDIEVTQELFEIDRNRFTCAGGTAAIDMMLSIIAKQKGADIAAQVTDQLIHHRIRDAHERQRMELRARLGVAHPKLLAVVQELPSRVGPAVLVGHNPGIEELVDIVTRDASKEAARAIATKYPTSGLAVLEFEGEWHDLGPSSAYLRSFVAPRGAS